MATVHGSLDGTETADPLHGMSKTTAAELSLINDSEFLEELGQYDGGSGLAPDPDQVARPMFDDPFGSLDHGLQLDPAAPVNDAPHYDQEVPTADPYDDPDPLPVPTDRNIPFLAAALVIAACLTAGAVTAAYVFEDRLVRITATHPASR